MEPTQFRAAVEAAQRGDRKGAYQLMRQLLIEAPDYVPGWLWMSGLVDTPKQQRECLERALAIDPNCQPAKKGLQLLELQEVVAAVRSSRSAPGTPQRRKIGTYLIEQGFITEWQLEQALVEQSEPHPTRGEQIPLGDILLEHNWLTPDALATALVLQQQETLANQQVPPQRLGEYLLTEGLLDPKQLEEVLAEQARLRKAGNYILLGEILLHSGYLTPRVLELALQQQAADLFSSFRPGREVGGGQRV